MKLGCIRMEKNDDGTFQVNVDTRKDNGDYSEKRFSYGASSLEDAISKVKEAEKEIGGMKESKKEKGKPNRSLAEYVGE